MSTMHCCGVGCSMTHLARRASCHCSSDGRLSPPGAAGRRPDTSMETERRLGRLSYSSSSVLACGGCRTSPASSSAVRDGEDASGCVRFFLKCCCRDLSLGEQQGGEDSDQQAHHTQACGQLVRLVQHDAAFPQEITYMLPHKGGPGMHG